jgi:prophage regulatory protein
VKNDAEVTGHRVDTNAGCTSPLLLTARQAAALCSTSLRTWRSWDSTGKIPRAVRIGGKVLWRSEELRAWVAAGCPDRVTWESTRQ